MRHSELPNRHSEIPKFAGEPAIVDEVGPFQLNLRANTDIILTILSDEKCCIELQDSVAETQADSVEPLRSISTDFHISQSRMYWLCADTSAPDYQSHFKHASCVCVSCPPRANRSTLI